MTDYSALKILLIEDDATEAHQLLDGLRSLHSCCSTISHCDDYATACEQLSDTYFDAVLLDMSMPGIEPLDSVQHLHNTYPDLCIVALDTEHDDDLALGSVQNGAQDYLLKQFAKGHVLQRVVRFALERKHITDELRASQQREKNLLFAAGEGIIGIDMEGNCTFINPSALHMLGYHDENELLGHNLHRMIHHTRPDGSHCNDHDCRIYKTFRKGLAIHEEQDIFWRADGKSIPVDYQSVPLQISGEITGSVITFSDITERKQMMSDLAHAHEYLEQQVKDRTHHLETANRLLKKESAERLLAQVALQGEHDFISALLDTIGALVVVLDQKGRIVRFNPACEHKTGYRFHEVEGRFVWDLFLLDEDIDAVKDVVNNLYSGQFPNAHQNYWLTKSGEKRFISWSNTVLLNEQNEVNYIIGTGIDVTETAEANKALIESEKKFRDLTEKSLVGVYLIQDKVFKYVNPQLAHVFGYSTEELIGMNARDFIFHEDKKYVISNLKKQIHRSTSSFHTTFRCVTRSGSLVDIETYGSRTIFQGKRAIIGTLLNITKRKIIEQALQEQMLRYEQILQTSMDGFLLVGSDGTILDVNPAYCEMLGYHSDELLQLNIADIDINLRSKHVSQHFKQLFHDEAVSFETQNKCKDDRIIDVEVSISVISTHGDDITALFARDITQRKHLEQSERARLLELAHTSRLSTMGEMATEIAHELNQPLSAIASYSSAASAISAADNVNHDDLHEALDGISKQAMRAGEIIRSLRDFIGKQETSVSNTDINDLIISVVKLIQSEARLQNIQINLNLNKQLPSIVTEKILIEQVILNLIRNAVEALSDSEQQDRTVDITSSLIENNMIQVNIEDNGPGLNYKNPDNVFEAFISSKQHGMGMGLAISRSIIETHSGKLYAQQNTPHGARFTFTLPVTLEDESL